MIVSEVGFWTCFGLIIYIYVGYPVIVFLLGPILNHAVKKANITPPVTVVIAAFNEEMDIQETVVNKLSQEYPVDQLDVIVVSDGSTDRTDEIVRGLIKQSQGRLRLLRQEPRQGKTQALNLALRHTASEIVVFSDANSIYAPSAVRALVRSFADSGVGYVTGQMVYTNPAGTGIPEGSSTYMHYENALRKRETRLGSIVGVDGGVDAIRRKLYVPMRPDQLPDFTLPLSVVEQGKRVVYEPDAVLFEPALVNEKDEYRMRVRVSLRAFWAMFDKRRLFNPARHTLFSWQLISHKVLRYAAFIPIAGMFLFNVFAVNRHGTYIFFLALQLALYAAAGVGHVFRQSSGVPRRFLAPYYFVLINLACMVAFWKFVQRQKMVLWTPRGGA